MTGQRVSASCSLGQEADAAHCEGVAVRNDFTGPAGSLGFNTVEDEVVSTNVIAGAEILSGPAGIDEYVTALGGLGYPDLHVATYQGEA